MILKIIFYYLKESRDKNSKARQSILADSVEAVIGAIYLDQGMEVVKDFVLKILFLI